MRGSAAAISVNRSRSQARCWRDRKRQRILKDRIGEGIRPCAILDDRVTFKIIPVLHPGKQSSSAKWSLITRILITRSKVTEVMVVCSRCIPVLEIINLRSNTAQLLVRTNVSTALTLACTSYQCKLGTRAEDLRCSRDQCLCNNGDTAGHQHTTQKLIAQCHKSKGQCDVRIVGNHLFSSLTLKSRIVVHLKRLAVSQKRLWLCVNCFIWPVACFGRNCMQKSKLQNKTKLFVIISCHRPVGRWDLQVTEPWFLMTSYVIHPY